MEPNNTLEVECKLATDLAVALDDRLRGLRTGNSTDEGLDTLRDKLRISMQTSRIKRLQKESSS